MPLYEHPKGMHTSLYLIHLINRPDCWTFVRTIPYKGRLEPLQLANRMARASAPQRLQPVCLWGPFMGLPREAATAFVTCPIARLTAGLRVCWEARLLGLLGEHYRHREYEARTPAVRERKIKRSKPGRASRTSAGLEIQE